MVTMSDEEPSKPDDIYHLSLYFSGRVQGVGFRYQTLQIAKGFDVTGFVKNLPDGRVQLEAEGEESEVQGFAADIEDQLGGYIRHSERRSGRRKQKFFDFTIN